MCHTLPEEAVKAAARALCRFGTSFSTIEATNSWVDEKWPRFKEEARLALTAALPFLSVQGDVKKLEWTKGVVDIASPHPGMKYVACSTTPKGSWAFWLNDAPETRAVFTSEEAAKAAAQADYEARVMSALEPTAARERALEEAARECEKRGAVTSADAIRALSSPDHADAGKVEGDGWPTGEYEVDYEVICNGEWVAGSTDLNDAKHYASVYSHDGEIEIVEARTYRRPLPSAPSEVAE